MIPGHWPGPWPAEDGGPQRRQAAPGAGLHLRPGERLRAVQRDVVAATMVVHRDPGETYLLRHTPPVDGVARSWVERIHPETLACEQRSPDLAGGPPWPGGLAAHANGSLYTVFGRHAHRLAPDTTLEASRELPRERPYNSFVVLADGCLATKDLAHDGPASELVLLEPDRLDIVARLALPQRSVARLSADGTSIYVVGVDSLLRVEWDGRGGLSLDDGFTARYRTVDGQTHGWDAVIDDASAWFLDDGAGSEAYQGSFRGIGISTVPNHLVRVRLDTGAVTLTPVCGLPKALVANPPAVDPQRRIVVGFDSSNGVLSGFRYDDNGLDRLWQRQQGHAAHMLRYPDTGELVTGDHDGARVADQAVVLDITTGAEKGRVDTGSPVQSVLFPAPGWGRDFYLVSFTTITRVFVESGP